MSEDFKAVEWMRQVRAKIDEEDAGIRWDDKHVKTIQVLERDPLWQKLKDRVVDPRAEETRRTRRGR